MTESQIVARRFAFEKALMRPDFSHVERILQNGQTMLHAYRHDPASSAGKGWLAAHPETAWAHVTMLICRAYS